MRETVARHTTGFALHPHQIFERPLVGIGHIDLDTTDIRWRDDRRGPKNYVLDILAVTFSILLLATIAVCPVFLQSNEDATILFRYSDNFAETGVISYNLDGPRTEGATDFLWMLLLSGARRAGLTPYAGTGVINVAAILATVLLLFRIARKRVRPTAFLSVLLAFLLLPQILAAVAGFSVLLFGAMIVASAHFFLTRNEIALAISLLFLCLLRPDGLVFALPMLAFRLYRSPDWPRQAVVYALGFLAPFALYFAWRWSYFGEMFPLPFLVKSDAVRWLGIVVPASVNRMLLYVGLAAPIVWLACGRRVTDRSNLSFITALIFFPSVFYAELRLDQNIGDRFFYYIAIGVSVIVSHSLRHSSASPRRLALAIALALAVMFPIRWLPVALGLARDSVSNITALLFDMRQSGLSGRMAVTEAGWLPYYTGWQAVDLWGLNTAAFAHHLVQPDQIRELDADLVVVHSPSVNVGCSVDPGWRAPYVDRSWDNMVANVIVGLSRSDYQLFIVPAEGKAAQRLHLRRHNFANEGDHYCYYVSARYLQRSKLIKILRGHGALTPVEFETLRHPS